MRPETILFTLPPVLALATAGTIVWRSLRSGRRPEKADASIGPTLERASWLLVVWSALTAGLGVWTATAGLILAFVPMHGGSGPVQYAGGVTAVFSLRVWLALLGLCLLPLATVVQTVASFAAWNAGWRGASPALLASALAAAGVAAGFLTLGFWFPTA